MYGITTRAFGTLLLVLSLVLTMACKKPVQDNTPLPSNWLLPLVKGHLSLNDLSRLNGQQVQYHITPADFGLPSNTTISSPTIEIAQLGPFTLATQDIIKYILVDSLDIHFDFENLFPTTIDSGFRIVLRTSADTSSSSNIVYSESSHHALLPNMKDSLILQIHQGTFTDSLYFFLENLKMDSFQNLTFNKNIPISIRIQHIKLKEIAFYTNKSITVHDTVDFKAGDLSSLTQALNVDDTAVSGHLNFFTDNGMPVNCSMQLQFMNNLQPVDSLFDQGFQMTGASVNSSGLPQNIISEKNIIGVRKSKLKNIESCNRMEYRFSINTNGYSVPYVVFRDTHLLGLQIVSDFELLINPFSF